MTPATSFPFRSSLLPILLLLALGSAGAGCHEYPQSVPTGNEEPKAARRQPDRSEADAAQDLAGKWRRARPQGPGAEAEEVEAEKALPNLKALPYLQGYRPAEDHPVISRRDPKLSQDGLNLYLSGHAAEAVLMDMDGHELHVWRYPLRRLWGDLARDPAMAKLEYWRRAYVYPNGDLLGIYEGQGLVKLDSRSRVLWSQRGGIHHDLEVTANGDIWVLDRDGKLIPRLHPTDGVLEDMITVLDREGRVRRRISILRALERSRFRGLLARRPPSGDIFHTNTLEILDGRFAAKNPVLRKGNVLISLLKLDTIAILDPDREEVVWAETGIFRRQHQPTFLPNGHLLVFDNTGPGGDRSRVLEFDPFGPTPGRTLWQYGGRPGEDLFSKTLGSCQRLSGGNTLITESENGRAFEVTPEGRVVWEFRNPHRAGAHGELVAVLFEMLRLPLDFPFPPRRGTIPVTSPREPTPGAKSPPGGLS